MGCSNDSFLDPWDDLERQHTSPHAPLQTPVKNFIPCTVKLMLAAWLTHGARLVI